MHTHTQNKHSNPGLEGLSDDTAHIVVKTFTLLFLPQSFHLFIVSSIYSGFCFFPPLLSQAPSLAWDVLATDGGGGGVRSKGKCSQGRFRQGYLHHTSETEES